VIERILTSARHLEQAGARVAVIGQFVNNDADPDLREKVLEVNATCQEHFGPAHLDVQDFLTSPALTEATGVAPTREDLAARARAEQPPTLSSDPGRFDQLGDVTLAGRLRTGQQDRGLLETPVPARSSPCPTVPRPPACTWRSDPPSAM